MQSLRRTVTRVLSDIANGRNIESYALVLVAFVLAVIGLIDDAIPESLKFAVILAALALLVFQTTKPEAQPVDYDAVLRDRHRFGHFRDFIKGGKTLWIYGPSAGNILRFDSDIKREVLDRGGTVQILMQNPNAPVMNTLPRQYNHTHPLREDVEFSLRTLQNLVQGLSAGTLDYGLLDHNPGFSLVVVDPDNANGRLVVEFHGYDSDEITDRMHIMLTRLESRHWFDYWSQQFESMWQARQPVGE